MPKLNDSQVWRVHKLNLTRHICGRGNDSVESTLLDDVEDMA